MADSIARVPVHPPPPEDPHLPDVPAPVEDVDAGTDERHGAAVGALRAAFTRLQPQGSDAWNFLAAFTHLGDRYGPYKPGASELSRSMEATEAGSTGPGGTKKPGAWEQRLRQQVASWGASLGAGGRPGGGAPGVESELEQAMAQVVEAFRFLSARVRTLEERLALEDRPLQGAAWLLPAQELGGWVDPVAAYIVGATPGGEVLHADCGEGHLVEALEKEGILTYGVEPRGAVALGALERGRRVEITEVMDALGGRPPSSLGGLVLSGVVDRLPLHALVSLLARARVVLALGAPILIVASDPEKDGAWSEGLAQDLLPPRPLHAEAWELLLQRAGFVSVSSLDGRGAEAEDGRFALVAACPT
jgi:hypothetical protein